MCIHQGAMGDVLVQGEEQRLTAAVQQMQQMQDAMLDAAQGDGTELTWMLNDANTNNTQLTMQLNMANYRIMQLTQQVRKASLLCGLLRYQTGRKTSFAFLYFSSVNAICGI